MRFGVGALEVPVLDGEGAAAYGAVLEHARVAEEHGFHSVWVMERHFSAGGGCPHAPATAAALAAATHSLRIGVIAPLGLTGPLYVAEDMAVLDNIAGGRAEFAARLPHDDESAGYALPREETASRFAEALETALRAWAPRPFRMEGGHYQTPAAPADGSGGPARVSVTPKPAQLRLPLWLFAADEDQARQAALLGADLLLPPWDRLESLRAKSRAFADTLAEAGRPRWTATVAACREVFVAPTRAALRAVAGPLERRYGLYAPLGLADGETYADLAPERFVVGDVDAVIDELRRYRDEADLDYVVCRFTQPGLDAEAANDAARLFGRGVMPDFQMADFPQELRLRAL